MGLMPQDQILIVAVLERKQNAFEGIIALDRMGKGGKDVHVSCEKRVRIYKKHIRSHLVKTGPGYSPAVGKLDGMVTVYLSGQKKGRKELPVMPVNHLPIFSRVQIGERMFISNSRIDDSVGVGFNFYGRKSGKDVFSENGVIA